jgi:hypothetical protein
MIEPGPIARRAVEVAESYLGTTEHGGQNRGAEVERFLASVALPPGQPWCAALVRHCLETAAEQLGLEIPPGFPDSGWCPSFSAWAQREQRWIAVQLAMRGVTTPLRGDLALFWFPPKGRHAHIGFIAASTRGSGGVISVEGNTSGGDGVNREGDGVWTKRRQWTDFGVGGGFVRLAF